MNKACQTRPRPGWFSAPPGNTILCHLGSFFYLWGIFFMFQYVCVSMCVCLRTCTQFFTKGKFLPWSLKPEVQRLSLFESSSICQKEHWGQFRASCPLHGLWMQNRRFHKLQGQQRSPQPPRMSDPGVCDTLISREQLCWWWQRCPLLKKEMGLLFLLIEWWQIP